MDIKELWQIELGDKVFGAVPECNASAAVFPMYGPDKYLIQKGLVQYDEYFNDGLLLINTDYFRNTRDLIFDGIDFLNYAKATCTDQNVLNYLFAKNYVKLPEKFDQFIRSERLKDKERTQIRNVIYHYTSDTLQLDPNDVFNRLWMSYFMRTPFFDAGTIGRLYDGFKNIQVELKQSAINISALMSGKTRAFFIAPQNVNAVKKIFSIRDDEEIILAESKSSRQKLIDAIKVSRGKKVFFIMLPNFPFQMLIQAGFKYGKDFVNGFDFLSEAHGLPLNSYPLIKAM